jgi:ketosteroid isomerase-like protein
MIVQLHGIAVLALTVAVSSASAQTPSELVRVLDSAWARSYATHDTAFAQALFATELAVTSGAGAVKTREEELADVRPSTGLQMHFFRTKDVDVRMYPGTAIVIGLAEWEFEMGGQTRNFRRRYTAVYVRGGSLGWRMVALHLSPAPVVKPSP